MGLHNRAMKPACLLLTVALFVACQSTPSSIPTVPSGPGTRWSDPQTWGGNVPGANSSITIPAGKSVVLDQNASVRNVTVLGTLIFDDKDLELTAGYVMVERGGLLSIGNELKPFTKRATITLTGGDTAENVMGMGTKFLGAMNGGKLEIWGEDRVSWTQLNASTPANATQITLARDVDWRVGERIVIASSALDPNQAETRTITAVDGKTVTLNQALEFAHFGQLQTFEGKTLDERAEVGLLSRNIVVQGDASSDASGFGGHVMVMGASGTARETNPEARSGARIRGVEFRRLGQYHRLGRYPLHWHRNGDSSGSFVQDSSFHTNYQRGVVIHASDNVNIQENVVYASVGHSFMTEDRSEVGNSFEANLGVLTKPFLEKSPSTEQAAQNDDQAATFWIRGPKNRFVGNHAAGGWHSGFWFDAPGPTDANFAFLENTAHSYLIGRGVKGGCCFGERGAIWITNDDFGIGSHGPFPLTNTTLYKNREAFWALPISGDGHGSADVDFNNAILADNALGLSSHGLRDSLVIGRSANTDADPEVGRAGVQEYGNTTRIKNVTFVNFKNGNTVFETRNCFREAPNVITNGIKLVNAELNLCTGSSDLSILDDGSLSGTGQVSTITPASDESGSRAMWTAACTLNAASGVRVCPGKFEYWNLLVNVTGGSTPNLIRDDNVQLEANDVTSYPFYWTMIQGRTYRLSQDLGATSAMRLRASIKYNNESDDGVLRSGRVIVPAAGNYAVSQCDYGPFDGMTCKSKTALPAVNTAAALEGRESPASYFDATTKQLHLWLVAGTDTSVLLERK
jgi:hypothetical protein